MMQKFLTVSTLAFLSACQPAPVQPVVTDETANEIKAECKTKTQTSKTPATSMAQCFLPKYHALLESSGFHYPNQWEEFELSQYDIAEQMDKGQITKTRARFLSVQAENKMRSEAQQLVAQQQARDSARDGAIADAFRDASHDLAPVSSSVKPIGYGQISPPTSVNCITTRSAGGGLVETNCH